MTHLRLIVACSACSRQYDASGHQVGDFLRCLCGERIEVPLPRPQQAAVVRCSSCGGPRQDNATACEFCGGDFTLHELDLDTLCPRCMTRISREASYCHHCAQPILVTGSGAKPTRHICPVCEGEQTLTSRTIGASGVNALECGRCVGLWLGNDAFRVLAQRAKSEQLSIVGHGVPPAHALGGWQGQAGPVYRNCPICSRRMNRRNYGRRSGIILDICGDDGVWFDAHELEQVLDWLRRGGQEVAAQLEKEEEREQERKRRAERLAEPAALAGHYGRRAELSTLAAEGILGLGKALLLLLGMFGSDPD